MKIVQSFETIKNHRKDFPGTFFRADETIFINLNAIADDLLTKESVLDENTTLISLVVNTERIEFELMGHIKEWRKEDDAIAEVTRRTERRDILINKAMRRFKLLRMIDKAEKEVETLFKEENELRMLEC